MHFKQRHREYARVNGIIERTKRSAAMPIYLVLQRPKNRVTSESGSAEKNKTENAVNQSVNPIEISDLVDIVQTIAGNMK